jgi:cytochrome c553
MWERDFRKNSSESMEVVAKNLDDQDREAVAAYFQQVREPGEVAASQ